MVRFSGLFMELFAILSHILSAGCVVWKEANVEVASRLSWQIMQMSAMNGTGRCRTDSKGLNKVNELWLSSYTMLDVSFVESKSFKFNQRNTRKFHSNRLNICSGNILIHMSRFHHKFVKSLSVLHVNALIERFYSIVNKWNVQILAVSELNSLNFHMNDDAIESMLGKSRCHCNLALQNIIVQILLSELPMKLHPLPSF